MAAIANLTLTDAAGTPVNHTFVPQDCTSDLATWNETAGGISIGMPQFTFSLKLGSPGHASKILGNLVLPTLETLRPGRFGLRCRTGAGLSMHR
jgi:hypothetical protein